MKRLIKILGLPVFMLMCLLPAGCDEFCDGLLSQEPETMVSDVNFWRTEDDVAAMTAQLHARLRNCSGGWKPALTATAVCLLILKVTCGPIYRAMNLKNRGR